MKITCLIDNLTAGGTKQLCLLAILLKNKGFQVKIITYHPQDFFLSLIQKLKIEYICIFKKNRLLDFGLYD